MAHATAPDDSVLQRVLALAEGLRRVGVSTSVTEILDASRAVTKVDLLDRGQLRSALRSTLVKRSADLPSFEALFDRHFEPTPVGAAGDRMTGPGTDHAAPPTDAVEALVAALRAGDTEALRALAAAAVDRYAGFDRMANASERYFLYRVTRALDLSSLLRRVLQAERSRDDLSPLDQRLLRADLTARLDELRRLLAEQVRRRLAADTSRPLVALPIEEVDFLDASLAEQDAMREAVRPLARQLAARISTRRRRRRAGHLDVRRTIRGSMSAGGIPLDPAFRRPHPARADLLVLSDFSGSVAEFARFALLFLQAMDREFPRVRSFAFVDGVADITEMLERSERPLEAGLVVTRPGVVERDGHSDYGRVFERFRDRFSSHLGPRTTVIITGDARNNYRATGAEALHEIRMRSRRVYWLNPEPAERWNTTDSVVNEYEPHCHRVFEVRNLRQLAAFVEAVV